MNKRKQIEYLEKLYKKQMKKKGPLPKELKEKLAFYKAIYGKGYYRAIFKANISGFIQPTPHMPHGWLALYDDMTEKDLGFFFRIYKNARIERLRSVGVRIRKYLTINTLRDYEWAKLIERNKRKITIEKIAQKWSQANRAQVREMVLNYLWKKPSRSHSEALIKLFQDGKKKRKKFVDFIADNAAKLTKTALNPDTQNYVAFYLPCRMLSAANRYKTKPY